jgi:hypothetical protein
MNSPVLPQSFGFGQPLTQPPLFPNPSAMQPVTEPARVSAANADVVNMFMQVASTRRGSGVTKRPVPQIATSGVVRRIAGFDIPSTRGPAREQPPAPTQFHRLDVDDCSICQMPIVDGEEVFTTRCNHEFHVTCAEQWLSESSTLTTTCPVCRCPFEYSQDRISLKGSTANNAASSSSTTAPPLRDPLLTRLIEIGKQAVSHTSQMLPWWPVGPNDSATDVVYHASTQCPGEVCLLINTGAVGNLQGSEWARELAQTAKHHNHVTFENRRNSPLHVAGVGSGQQTCSYDGIMPIAVPRSDNTHTLETFTAPIVPDSPVPGLLGLESMTTKRTIIDTVKNQLITLGPGDYSIQLPPGSEVLPVQAFTLWSPCVASQQLQPRHAAQA